MSNIMASPEDIPQRSSSRKLQKRPRAPHRLPSTKLPARLRGLGDDAHDDVTAPDRGKQAPAQYMNQSIFSMIAAAGSRTDFNTRFDDSSESEGDIPEEDEDDKRTEEASHKKQQQQRRRQLGSKQRQSVSGQPTQSQSQVQSSAQQEGVPVDMATTTSGSELHKEQKKKKKRLSDRKLMQSLHRLSSMSRSRSRKGSRPTGAGEDAKASPRSPSPASEESTKSSSSNPRDAPVMSRLLTAEAEFEAASDESEQLQLNAGIMEGGSGRSRGESSPATLLATRLMTIFGFEKPERVVAEYPCWLLQSVLLQGYLYITKHHICFYAYLPKKSNTIAKNGYLSKRGKSNPKYNRYWFVLKGDVLSYYSNPSDQYFPQGNVDLRYGISASLTAEKDKLKDCKDFSVTTDHRTYHFRADSVESAKEWVKTLQRTIFRSHNDGDSVKISLPVENIIEVDPSPVVEFAETIQVRVVEDDDSYAVDDYFFSFFNFGEDVLNVLRSLVTGTQTPGLAHDTGSPGDGFPFHRRARSPGARQSLDLLSPRDRSTTPLREGVKATLKPFAVGDDGKMSPRMSGEFTRPSQSPARHIIDLPSRDYGRASFDRGRRSPSTGRLDVAKDKRTGRSPLARAHDSPESSAQQLDTETESSVGPLSPKAEAHMSASQILTRSDVFHPPKPHRMDTLASVSTVASTKSEIESPADTSVDHATRPIPIRTPSGLQRNRRSVFREEDLSQDIEKPGRNIPSPALQDIVKAGSYPLQRAGQWAGYLKSKSGRMTKLVATDAMSYMEKISGMWAGNRKHYSENEAVLPDDRDVDPEDEEANVGYGDRFRTHFALPTTEKLQATYFGFLHRVLPLYGKVYISNKLFCFRSLLPGTKTKLVLPLKDIENVDKEKGFRFGYHGLVLVIRGHEELFFEFSSSEHRDDCAVTLLQTLESIRYMAESTTLSHHDEDSAAIAKSEHRLLQEARHASSVTGTPIETNLPPLPDTNEAIYSHETPPPILFDDPRVSIINFKPPASLRITCLTIGSRGDVQPYIALCKGLLAEGHRPTIATHHEFGPWILSHGIAFAPVEGDPAELMRICVENGMFTYSFLREASSKFRTWIDELLTSAWQACQGSDLLIESPSAMAGIHIAEALQIPYFRAFSMPWTRTRGYPHAFAVPEHKMGGAYNYYSYVMFDNVFWKAIASQVNRWRKKELGLRSTNLDKMQPNKVPFLYSFSPSVVVPPLDYSDWVRVTGYWFLDEGEGSKWTPPKELTEFIDKARKDGKKLVYIGFGSIVVSDPAGLTRTVVEAVLKADVRCILSKGWSDRLGGPAGATAGGADAPPLPPAAEVPLPPEIHQVKSVPHDWLFTQIDAAVHHGGAGTTGASLRAGLPTVCKPFFGDQFFFGSRVEDLGVGICLRRVNVGALSRALWEACNDERMRGRARGLGERIRRENGVNTAIQSIYRDLDYATSIVKSRAEIPGNISSGGVMTADDGEGGEESWTFIGDESDPELMRRVGGWRGVGGEMGDTRGASGRASVDGLRSSVIGGAGEKEGYGNGRRSLQMQMGR